MQKDTFLIKSLFWAHALIVLFFIAPFFIPLSIWPKRVEFHFYYVIFTFASEILWGVFMIRHTQKRLNMICPVTSLMQKMRGISLSSPENYKHSFVVEFFERYKLPMSMKLVNIIILISVLILFFQFLF